MPKTETELKISFLSHVSFSMSGSLNDSSVLGVGMGSMSHEACLTLPNSPPHLAFVVSLPHPRPSVCQLQLVLKDLCIRLPSNLSPFCSPNDLWKVQTDWLYSSHLKSLSGSHYFGDRLGSSNLANKVGWFPSVPPSHAPLHSELHNFFRLSFCQDFSTWCPLV